MCHVAFLPKCPKLSSQATAIFSKIFPECISRVGSKYARQREGEFRQVIGILYGHFTESHVVSISRVIFWGARENAISHVRNSQQSRYLDRG